MAEMRSTTALRGRLLRALRRVVASSPWRTSSGIGPGGWLRSAVGGNLAIPLLLIALFCRPELRRIRHCLRRVDPLPGEPWRTGPSPAALSRAAVPRVALGPGSSSPTSIRPPQRLGGVPRAAAPPSAAGDSLRFHGSRLLAPFRDGTDIRGEYARRRNPPCCTGNTPRAGAAPPLLR